VKWPKYVRLQRQRRVLSMRLKVPPALNRFVTRHADKGLAETLFKLLLKWVAAGGGGLGRGGRAGEGRAGCSIGPLKPRRRRP
jgi:hypothetical protein